MSAREPAEPHTAAGPSGWPRRSVGLVGVGLLGFASMALELVSFRLDAAILGRPYAWLVAIAVPALGGFAAALVGARHPRAPATRDAGNAAIASLVAGAASAAAAVALVWVSQVLGKKDAPSWAVWLPFAAFVATSGGAAAALALATRALRDGLGRVGFSFGAGGAVGALAVPLFMKLGAPRSLLVLGLVLAAAAISFARSARDERPRGFGLVTLPLALAVLLAGDLRVPWLRVRTDAMRRGRVGHAIWSPLGVIAVDPIKQQNLEFTVDQLEPTALLTAGKGKAPWATTDLVHALDDRRGRALLVVASGGAREVGVALAEGFERVDAIEPSHEMLSLLAWRYHRETGGLLQPGSAARFTVGDGRDLAEHAEKYPYVVVAGASAFEQAAPRFLLAPERLVTVEALRGYLAVLEEPRGILLVRTPKERLDVLLATLGAAAGGLDGLGERVVVCSEREADGAAAVVFRHGKFGAPERERLTKECRRKGLTVELPSAELRRGDRNRDEKERAHDERLAQIAASGVMTDERQVRSQVRVRAVVSAARAEVKALRTLASEPRKKRGARDAASNDASGDRASGDRASGSSTGSGTSGKSTSGKHAEAAGDREPASVAPELATTALGAALALVLVLLALLLPIHGGRESAPRTTWRIAMPLFGLASGLALVPISEHALRLFGSPGASWALVIPLTVLGSGTGRLAADVAARERLARSLCLAGVVGAAGLGLLGFGAPQLLAMLSPSHLGLAVGCALTVLVAALASAPSTLALRLVAERSPHAVGWAVGAELAGWGAGLGVAQLLVRYLALSQLFAVAAFVLALAGLGAWHGGRERPTARA